MRLALIVSSTYKKSSQLPGLPSAAVDAELMEERFSEPDTRAAAERLVAGPKLEAELERTLARHCREREQSAVVFYFSGHVMLRDDGELALLLDSRRGGSLDLARVRELLHGAAEDALVVLDIVHAPDEEDPMASATTVAAVRDAVAPKKSGIGVLVGARPSDSPTPSGPSLFTRLFLLALEHLTPTRARSGAVRAGAVYEEMRAEEERFMEIPAAGYFRGAGDFALLEMPSIVIKAESFGQCGSQRADRAARPEHRASVVAAAAARGGPSPAFVASAPCRRAAARLVAPPTRGRRFACVLGRGVVRCRRYPSHRRRAEEEGFSARQAAPFFKARAATFEKAAEHRRAGGRGRRGGCRRPPRRSDRVLEARAARPRDKAECPARRAVRSHWSLQAQARQRHGGSA